MDVWTKMIGKGVSVRCRVSNVEKKTKILAGTQRKMFEGKGIPPAAGGDIQRDSWLPPCKQSSCVHYSAIPVSKSKPLTASPL